MPDNTAIRSFQVSFPEADVAELRRRIKVTRWPQQELVSDAASRRIWSTPAAVGPTQGVQLATMQKLIQYWGADYEWSRCEAHLKSLPHFITQIDGLDIHFIHVKSKHQTVGAMSECTVKDVVMGVGRLAVTQTGSLAGVPAEGRKPPAT